MIHLEIKTHMFPVSDVTAVFFKRTYAYPTNSRYRPAAEKSKIQHADRFSLAKRIEHPIGHVKMYFFTRSLLSSDLFESRSRCRLKFTRTSIIYVYVYPLNQERTTRRRPIRFEIRMIIV